MLAPSENGQFPTFRKYILPPSSVSKYVGLIGPVIGAEVSSSHSVSLMESLPKKQELLTPLKLLC